MNTNRLLQLITGTVAMMLMAVVSVVNVQAQDYYVNISGGNDAACNGSSANVATVPNCPFKTIDRALTAATGAAGTQTIQVAAGNYTAGNGEADPLAIDTNVNFQAAPFNANTIVNLGIDLDFDATVAMASSGATFSSTSGVFDLIDGTLTLEASVLSLASGTLVTRTDGSIAGAAPVFGATTDVTYDGGDTVAGLELPADLGGGTLLVSIGVADDFSASANVTATTIDIDSGDTVIFTGDVTADDVDIDGAGSHSFADVFLTGGNFAQEGGAGDTSTDNVALAGGRLIVTSGSFSSSGTVSNNLAASNDGAAGDGGSDALVVHDSAGDMDLTNIAIDYPFNNNSADNSYVQTIQNISGEMTIAGTMTEESNSDANEDDESIFELIVEGGELIISQSNTISSLVDVPGGELTFSNGGVLNADLDNDALVNIDGGTLELTTDIAAFTTLGVFAGDGKLYITGDADVDAGGIEADGDVELAGDNNAAVAATLLVNEGDIIFSGDFTGTGWSGAANDVEATLGSVTITGDVGAFGGDLTAGTNVTFEDGDGVDGDLDVGGDLVANSDVFFAGLFTVDANATLNGDHEINGVIDVGGDLTVGDGATLLLDQAAAVNDIAGDLIVNGSMEFDAGDGSETSADNVSIAKNVGSVELNDNDLNVSGDWDGGFFSATNGSEVVFALSANHTFAPGPNTVFDDLTIDGNERTLTATGSFEVAGNLSISDDATLDITSNLLSMSGDDATLMIAEDAFLIADPETGAVSFTGSDAGDGDAFAAVIDVEGGTASITSFIINTADNAYVFLDSSGSPTAELTVSGVISLVTGGFDLSDGDANELIFMTDNAGIIVNLDGVNTNIDDDGGTASISGLYDLTYNGTGVGPYTAGDEYDIDSIDDLSIDADDIVNLDNGADVEINGNLSIASGSTADLGDDLTVNGFFTIAGDITDGSGNLILDSATAQTHSLTGDISTDVFFESDATVNGSSDDGDVARFSFAVFVNATVVFNDIQAFEDDFIVEDAGFATVGMVDADDDDADAAGEDRTMDDVFIEGAGTFTLASDLSIFGGFTVGDDSGDPTLNMDGNDLIMYGGAFAADGDADLGTTGVLVLDSGATVDTDQDADGPSVLPNLTVDDGDAAGDVAVTGNIDINEVFAGGFTFTVSGHVFMDADIVNDVVINGTTVELEDDYEIGGDLTVNATSVLFTTDDTTAPITDRELNVTGTIFMVAGDVSIVNFGLYTETSLDYEGGTFSFGDLDDFFAFDGATLEGNGNNVIIPNVGVEGGALVIEDDDILTVGAILVLITDIEVDEDGTLVVGDDSGEMIIGLTGGNIDITDADGTLTFGTDQLTLLYDGTPATDDEMPAEFYELQVDDGVTLSNGDSPTVMVLDLNDDLLMAPNTENVTVADGGRVELSAGAGLDDDITYAGAFNLVYDGLITPLDEEWDPNDVPASLTIEDDWFLDTDRQVVDVTVDASDLDLFGDQLGVSGGFSLINGGKVIDTSGGGTLSLNGTAPQLVNAAGGIEFPASALEIDNAMGVTLTGGNIDFRDGVFSTIGGTLVLTNGVFATGTNVVFLDHAGTANQGYTQTGGTVFGNIRKEIVGGVTTADRMEFPVGTADGDFRPTALTFNNPNTISGSGESGIFLTASHVEMSPGGNNNMPLTTIDDQGNELVIARYPSFYWHITSSSTLSPNIDYDVELHAAGYNEFAGETIEDVRTIRRQAGAMTNFWTLVGGGVPANNDNFAISATEPVTVVRDAVGAIIGTPGTFFTMGLESNLVVTEAGPVAVNAGGTADLDLSTVFSGGTGGFTYTVTSDDATIATGATAGDVLTVTGVAEGSTNLVVVAVDALNDTRTANVAVNVSSAFTFVAGADEDEDINVGDSQVGDLTTVFVGGTAPLTYAAVSDDPSIASISISGTEATLTGVAVGMTDVTFTATDGTGATAEFTITVTVHEALVVTVPATVTLTEGEVDSIDLSTVFSGGDGDYTYEITSAAPANVSAEEALEGFVTITAVDAYAGGTTVGIINVMVTATDGTDATATATIPVDVYPVLGDLTGSGGPSAASAALALDFWLGRTTLTAKQQTAADFNTDGSVTPFDAALIFQAIGAGKTELDAFVSADLAFGTVAREAGSVSVPLKVDGNFDKVGSISFVATIDPSVAKVTSVTSELGEGWISGYTVSEEGEVRFAVAGHGSIPSDGNVATINLDMVDGSASLSISADGAVNNNPLATIDAVEVVELPETFSLHGNYPNPFNPSTTIQFDLPETADVEVQVIDVLGRLVMTLPSQTIEAGTNRSLQLNASQLASGSYFYRVIAKMESRTLVQTNRMTLVK